MVETRHSQFAHPASSIERALLAFHLCSVGYEQARLRNGCRGKESNAINGSLRGYA
jgi:hypothetical protein